MFQLTAGVFFVSLQSTVCSFKPPKSQDLVMHLSADRLAQFVEHRTTMREVAGSNPGRTTTQGL